MQLNVLFDFLGKSFSPQGEEAAKNADGADRPAGFGSALAAALGIGARDGSSSSSDEHTPRADAELVVGDADARPPEGEATPAVDGDASETSVVSAGAEISAESSAAVDGAPSQVEDSASVPFDDADNSIHEPARVPAPAPNKSESTPSEVATLSSDVTAAAPSETESTDPVQETPSVATPPSFGSEAAAVRDLSNESGSQMSPPFAGTGTPSTTGMDGTSRTSSNNTTTEGAPATADTLIHDTTHRPTATTTSSAEAASVGHKMHDVDGLEPRLTTENAAKSLSTSAADGREDASNPTRAVSPSNGRSVHATPGDTAAADAPLSPSPSEAPLEETQPASGRVPDSIPRSEAPKPSDPGDHRTPHVRAADLARAAQQPSEATLSHGVPASKDTTNAQKSAPDARFVDGKVAMPSSNTAPSTDRADIPAGIEDVTVLEDGASFEESPTGSGRRSTGPTASSTRNAPAAPDASTNSAVVSPEDDLASDTIVATDVDEAMRTDAADAEGADEPEIAVNRSDDGVRRANAQRSDADGDRKEASDTAHLASQGDRQFSDGDSGAFSRSRDEQVSTGKDGNSALGAVTSEFEPTVADLLIDDILVDVEPSSEDAAFTPELKTTIAGVTSAEGLQTSARSHTPGSIAWLRSILAQSTRTLEVAQGWKSIQVQLEQGQGTMTVTARRNEDGVSVSVSFSDPHLQSLAEANAHRLQDVLRAEYEANVDLSLMSDGSTDTPGERNQPGSGRPSLASGTLPNGSIEKDAIEKDADAAHTLRPTPAGIRNEWIG